MNLNLEPKILRVKSGKDYKTIIFTIIWLFILLAKIKYINDGLYKPDFQSKAFSISIFIVTFYLIYETIWILVGETIFSISDNSLIVKSGIFFLKRTKRYMINHISNVKIKSDVPSSAYWGFLGARFYDYKTILCFNYNSKQVILGLNLSSFDLDTLEKWIS